MESFRNTDMKAENQLSIFMDRCFYSKLLDKNGKPVEFIRKADKESQLNGIDVELITNGKKIYIDEKASLYYSNLMIPTFAFEIDSIQKGHIEPVEGWFLNNDLATDYFMLIWPNIKCEKSKDNNWIRKDLKYLNNDDFTIVEAMLIEKNVLQNEVEKLGYGKSYLLEYAKRIRALQSNSDSSYTEKVDNNIKIMYSGQLAEKPVNVVIQKKFLKKVANAIYLISEDGFARIQ